MRYRISISFARLLETCADVRNHAIAMVLCGMDLALWVVRGTNDCGTNDLTTAS